MVVDIFIPCFIDQIYPQTAFNMIKVLEKIDIGVNYNTEQTCCGQVAFNSGFWEHAKCMGEKFIRDFPNDRYIVAPSASCVSMVRNYYSELFHNTALHNEYKQLQKNIFEFTDFLVNIMNVKDIGASFNGIVSYHDSCSALREYGIKDEPRILLENVRGIKIHEMKNHDTCCGFGGTFSVKNEAISTAMAEQKVQHAIDSGAEYIVSTEASCLMHIEAYIKKHNSPIKTIHIADILSSGY
ncbi:MAG TPA: (Fe-S)-binding protein [Bacteroidales bacterium]|nr:(Fe-S)-binding protein [Bacteroidales bacterium]HPS15669.1 (Fe-S)-binding protein [Bacteroidales bacterium]